MCLLEMIKVMIQLMHDSNDHILALFCILFLKRIKRQMWKTVVRQTYRQTDGLTDQGKAEVASGETGWGLINIVNTTTHFYTSISESNHDSNNQLATYIEL